MQWFRPLQTPGYKIYSGEASDVKDTVMCLHSHAFCVPSFSKRDNFEVTLEIIMVFSLGTHYLTGIHFSFHTSASFSFLHNSCTCQWEFVGTREGDQHTFSSQSRCFQRSHCYAPIQIKPNRVKTLSLRGIRTVR